MDIRNLLGASLRHHRLVARLSQEAVAGRMGVDRAYISAVERGVQNVTLLMLWEIAQALDVRPCDLLNESIVQPQSPHEDRKSVGKGKSASVRVDLGGRRSIKTNNNIEKEQDIKQNYINYT